MPEPRFCPIPGYRLVRAAIAEGLPVGAVPGANAAITALTLSGLPPHPFLFAGFPPPRSAARRSSFAILRAAERAGLSATLIWHEAPHRLAEALADLQAVFGDRDAAVARELTKRFEEVRRGTLADLAAHYQQQQARGEITVLVGPPPDEAAGQDELDTRLSRRPRNPLGQGRRNPGRRRGRAATAHRLCQGDGARHEKAARPRLPGSENEGAGPAERTEADPAIRQGLRTSRTASLPLPTPS